LIDVQRNPDRNDRSRREFERKLIGTRGGLAMHEQHRIHAHHRVVRIALAGIAAAAQATVVTPQLPAIPAKIFDVTQHGVIANASTDNAKAI